MTAQRRTRIKICGITRLEDAEVVAASGADALGLNFSDQSARQIDVISAAEISAAVSGRLTRVGLFVDHEREAVERILSQVQLDLLQFHGQESAALCGAFGLPYMKVHRVSGPLDMKALIASFPDACCHLLDAFVAGQPGGTGEQFDWRLWPAESAVPLVLAGGLHADNVEVAVARLAPFAVDVCGGVEHVKGIKDRQKIEQFIAAVRRADERDAGNLRESPLRGK